MNISSNATDTANNLANVTNKMEQSCTINEDNQLCINISDIPAIKTSEETACCIQFILYKIQLLLSSNERIDINLYLTKDIKMETFKTVPLFFEIFKKELPNKLNKCRIYTKAKYKGFASMLLSFADKETKSRMEILSQ
jgi:hypothetical protein